MSKIDKIVSFVLNLLNLIKNNDNLNLIFIVLGVIFLLFALFSFLKLIKKGLGLAIIVTLVFLFLCFGSLKITSVISKIEESGKINQMIDKCEELLDDGGTNVQKVFNVILEIIEE